MYRVGIATGSTPGTPVPPGAPSQLFKALRGVPDLVGVTLLETPAARTFARAVLDLGGELEVVLPSPEFREAVPTADRSTFEVLLAMARRACTVTVRRPDLDSAAAVRAARAAMLDCVDALVVLATEADDPTTARTVAAARERDLDVIVVPADAPAA